MYSVTTVGFGDIPVTNNYEKIYAILIMIIGNLCFLIKFNKGAAYYSFLISNL